MTQGLKKSFKQKYVLDLTKLQPYDIILTKGKGIISKSIRLVTKGEYSHAIICRCNTSIAEATMDGGVFSASPQRLSFDNLDDCKVLRLNRALSAEEQERLRMFIGSLMTSKYSIREAVRTKRFNKTKFRAKEKLQFCSRFVAQAYQQIGINLVNNPDYCSPEEINKSDALITVENHLRPMTEEDLAIQKKPNMVIINQKETYKWLDKAISLAKEKKDYPISTINDVLNFLLTHQQYDAEISTYIKETNYLEQYKDDEKANPERYSFQGIGSINMDIEVGILNSMIKHFMHEYNTYKAMLKDNSLEYLELHLKLYRNLLTQKQKHLLNIRIHAVLAICTTKAGSKEAEFLGLKIREINEMLSNINDTLK